jgi:2-polyprenyl-3-methyl-5-hydroxy-6-metoxy-1,4-benzoquinol methylase
VHNSLAESDDGADAAEMSTDKPLARKQRLHDQRLDRVAEELKTLGATAVLDLGCGSGKLLGRIHPYLWRRCVQP